MAATHPTIETWVPVAGFESEYEVSDLGRVRSLWHAKEFILSPILKTERGRRHGSYLSVWLFKPGQPRLRRSVALLVVEAFVGKQPSIGLQINHIDGNKLNNRVGNLEWVTQSENIRHAYRTGLNRSVVQPHPTIGEANSHAKLTSAQVIEIRLAAASGERHGDIADRYGVTNRTVSAIHTRRKWKHLPG